MTDTWPAVFLAQLRHWFVWVPDWVFGVFLLGLLTVLAVVVHSLAVDLLDKWVGARSRYLRAFLLRTRLLSRLALLIFAWSAVIKVAPFPEQMTELVSQALLVAFIVLMGWTVLTIAGIAADLYVSRFAIDTADNLLARKHVTQVRILRRAANTLIVVVTTGAVLMTFEAVRQYGVSLFASAGVAGIVVGFAARPVLANLIAGIQIAMTQPIRMDDAVIVEGEWGRVEEITGTYVVIKIWDWRRLIVPISYFIEHPFQNWTRETASLIGSVYLYVDYSTPVDRVRQKLTEFAKASKLWDGDVVNLQVTDAKDRTIELRALVSARSSGEAWDLRCEMREKLIDFLQREYPQALPQQRLQIGEFDGAFHGAERGQPVGARPSN